MSDNPLAVIVPALARDAHLLHRLLRDLGAIDGIERLVAVPSDELEAFHELRGAHPAVRWVASPRGRARQMNTAAGLTQARWLLFLHADCGLPGGWVDEIVGVAAGRGARWGCFRFALDSPAWQARLLEAGVRVRVAVWSLPYGDQGLFVRREVFDAVGGYPDLPLMEDVQLARTLARLARPWRSRLPLVTSARRWTREGWLARSRRNLWLLARYLAGGSAAGLAREYARPGRALVVMSAGEGPSAGSQSWTRGIEWLSSALASTPGVHAIVPLRWHHITPRILDGLGADLQLLPLSPSDAADDPGVVCERLATDGSTIVLLVPHDANLPGAAVRHALTWIERTTADVVLGTGNDGRCRLIGLSAARRPSLRGLTWARADLAVEVRARARAATCSLSELALP
jgi:rSAM/selenodomain-associated transferase 2